MIPLSVTIHGSLKKNDLLILNIMTDESPYRVPSPLLPKSSKKQQIIKRNTNAVKSTVKEQVKICNPSYYLPYAGFFSERAPRDAYVKTLNKKNKTSDYVESLKTIQVEVLDTSVNDSFLFQGKKIKEITKLILKKVKHVILDADALTCFRGDLKSLYSSLFNKVKHYCYFTTPRAQEILGKKCGFKKINTIGLFFGSTRIAFKLGKKFGNFYYGFLNKISKQRITKYFYKAFCGHLVVIGKK